jgi:hypothetical protein
MTADFSRGLGFVAPTRLASSLQILNAHSSCLNAHLALTQVPFHRQRNVPENRTMIDALFVSIVIAFGFGSWALLVLCDKLIGDHR